MRREILKRLIGYPAVLGLATLLLWIVSIRMPGRSQSGPLPPITMAQDSLRLRLHAHVMELAGHIGERNPSKLKALDSAATYIETQLSQMGYVVKSLPYTIGGVRFRNLEATLPGAMHPKEIILIGGHYDTVIDTPGADDNASGVAGMLEIARHFSGKPQDRTLRFVAFTNEEPPLFWTDDMGSLRYARTARARGDSIVGMLSLETLGYYSDSVGSQKYPPILGWFYPNKGDFVAFVGSIGSRELVHASIASFRQHATLPSAGSAAPKQMPGIGWSDQWSFWKVGYPAIMVTSTAPYRDPNYHQPSDSPEKLDYPRLARAVDALLQTVADLATARGS